MQKGAVVVLCVLTLTIVGSLSSCSNKEDKDIQSLEKTKWKLVGFADVESGKIEEAEPTDEWCYVLTFKKTNRLEGFTSNNSFEGEYKIDYSKKSINIFIGFITYAGEYLDGYLYTETLKNVDFFSLQENGLKLYYNDNKNYLLFNPLND